MTLFGVFLHNLLVELKRGFGISLDSLLVELKHIMAGLNQYLR